MKAPTYPGRDAFLPARLTSGADTGARRTDPKTSHTAAAIVDAEGQRSAIMGVLRGPSLPRRPGWTADEIDLYIGWRVTTAGRRLSELKRRGLVEPCGERPTRSGRPATVYRATKGNP